MAGGAAELGWKVVGLASGLLAARVSRSVMDKAWAKARGGDPPRNPAAPGTEWREAFTWAIASGASIGVARMLSTKMAATAWHKTTGSLPPGLETTGA